MIVLSYTMFPAHTVQEWLEKQFEERTPGIKWTIAEINFSFPGEFTVSKIHAVSEQNPDNLLFQAENFKLSFNLFAYLLKKPSDIQYKLQFPSGTCQGTAVLSGNRQLIQLIGNIQDVSIENVQLLLHWLNRSGKGIISGKYKYSRSSPENIQPSWKIDLAVEDGYIGFQEGVFDMYQFDFKHVSASFSQNNKLISISNGQINSNLLTGKYSGTIQPATDPLSSSINIQGLLKAQPKMLLKLEKNIHLFHIKTQQRDGFMAFILNGTFNEPGILFAAPNMKNNGLGSSPLL